MLSYYVYTYNIYFSSSASIIPRCKSIIVYLLNEDFPCGTSDLVRVKKSFFERYLGKKNDRMQKMNESFLVVSEANKSFLIEQM